MVRAASRWGWIALWVAGLALAGGCGGGGDGSFLVPGPGPGPGPGPAPSPAGPPLLGMANVFVPVEIVLPAGSALVPEELRAYTAAGGAALGADGRADVPAYEGGPQVVFVEDAGGRVVLMGFCPPYPGAAGPHAVSARTTAEVLVWLHLGAFSATDDMQAEFVRRVRGDPALDGLAAALETALGANPQALEAADAGVLAALDAAVAAIGATAGGVNGFDDPGPEPEAPKPAAWSKPAGAGPAHATILVEALGVGSGLSVEASGPEEVRVQNVYRRRGVALVERKGWTDATDVFHEDPSDVGAFLVPSAARRDAALGPADALPGATLGDFAHGALPHEPVASGPIAVPLTPGEAVSTTYWVTVVGPTRPYDYAPGTLTAAEDGGLAGALRDALHLDLVLPSVAGFVFPFTGEWRRTWIDAWGEADLARLHTLATGGPEADALNAALVDGLLHVAAGELLHRLVYDPAFQAAYLEVVFRRLLGLADGEPNARLDEFLAQGARVLALLSGPTGGRRYVLPATLSHFTQAAASRVVEGFEVVVQAGGGGPVNAEVTLSPPVATILGDQELTYVATVAPDLLGPGEVPSFRWTTSGVYGHLEDRGAAPQAGTDLETDSATLTYVPNGSLGVDTVSVEAFVDGPGGPALLGQATATVEVRGAVPVLSPAEVVLAEGERQAFSVTLVGVPDDGGLLEYRWICRQQFGRLLDASPGATRSRRGTATYRCWSSGRQGIEFLQVEVFSTKDGVTTSLGVAQAVIRISNLRKRKLFPSVRIDSWYSNDGGGWHSWGDSVAIVLPVVKNAVRYEYSIAGSSDGWRNGTGTVQPLPDGSFWVSGAGISDGADNLIVLGGGSGAGWFWNDQYTSKDGQRDADLRARQAASDPRWNRLELEATVYYTD